jgi:hypothetical protein
VMVDYSYIQVNYNLEYRKQKYIYACVQKEERIKNTKKPLYTYTNTRHKEPIFKKHKCKNANRKKETRERNKKEQSRYKYMLSKIIIYFYAVHIDRQKHWNGLYQAEGSAFDAGLVFDAGLDFDAGFPLTDAGFAFEEGFALAAVPLVAVLDLGLDTGFFTSPVTAYTVLLSRHAT